MPRWIRISSSHGKSASRVPVRAGGWTPTRLNDGTELAYGLGWEIRDAQGHKIVGHGGRRPGVSTRIARDREDRLTVILLIQAAGVDTWAMTSAILDLCRPL